MPLFDAHPGPIRISRRLPLPLSSRTARHRCPSALRVKVTPLAPLPLLPPLSPLAMASPANPASCELELPPVPAVRSDDRGIAPPVDGPATGGPAVVLGVPVPAAVPVETGVCGAADAVGAVGVELSLFAVDDVLTEVEGAAVGVVVVFVSDVTTADPPG